MKNKQLKFEKTKCLYENTIKQLESYRNTGYKIILAHIGLNISIAFFTVKSDHLNLIKENKIFICLFLFILWFLFFWWQIGLYLSAGRLNKIMENCLNIIATDLIDIPHKKKAVYRRYIPNLIIPFITTLLIILWIAIL